MKVVRKCVFETNSSSSHSLSIKRNTSGVYSTNYARYLLPNGKVELSFAAGFNFQWGPAEYTSSYIKLNYLVSLAYLTHNANLIKNNRPLIKECSSVLKIKDIVQIEKVLRKHVKGFTGFVISNDAFYLSGYRDNLELVDGIDHQSWEDFNNIDDFLKYHKISIENYLFNPKVKLIISNDNGA